MTTLQPMSIHMVQQATHKCLDTVQSLQRRLCVTTVQCKAFISKYSKMFFNDKVHPLPVHYSNKWSQHLDKITSVRWLHPRRSLSNRRRPRWELYRFWWELYRVRYSSDTAISGGNKTRTTDLRIHSLPP
jgi:hypothetical protein